MSKKERARKAVSETSALFRKFVSSNACTKGSLEAKCKANEELDLVEFLKFCKVCALSMTHGLVWFT